LSCIKILIVYIRVTYHREIIKMADQSTVYTTDHAASVVLDAGCGPGSITVDVARLVPHGHVTGVEYVPEPLEQARTLALSQGITNISFRVGDIHSLPFPDDSFDIAHVHQVLQQVADPIQALREMRRVVKPGGIVACRESASMAWYPESEGLETWNELSTRMRRAKGGNLNPGSYIHIWAKQGGFAGAEITRSASSWCFSSDDEQEYLGGSMEERAKSSGFTKMAVRVAFST
jgi:ubiquinone/menaquinone biosynthesis C-methylase UbiE